MLIRHVLASRSDRKPTIMALDIEPLLKLKKLVDNEIFILTEFNLIYNDFDDLKLKFKATRKGKTFYCQDFNFPIDSLPEIGRHKNFDVDVVFQKYDKICNQ